MTQNHDTFMPKPISLPCGIVAKIEITPAPRADERGRYRAQDDCQIQVSLFRSDAFIESLPWNTVVCGAANVELVDGSTLDADDINELDSSGWKQMIALGLLPGALLG